MKETLKKSHLKYMAEEWVTDPSQQVKDLSSVVEDTFN